MHPQLKIEKEEYLKKQSCTHVPVPRVIREEDGQQFTAYSVGFTQVNCVVCRECGRKGEEVDGEYYWI
jgi:hypothetical protein